MMEEKEERELNHWWKCKKWSYANLNRLFIRYVRPLSWICIVRNAMLMYTLFLPLDMETQPL